MLRDAANVIFFPGVYKLEFMAYCSLPTCRPRHVEPSSSNRCFVREDELRRVPWEISPPDDKLMLILSVRKEKIGVFL